MTVMTGEIRPTVWQNLLLSGVPDDKVAVAAIETLGERGAAPGPGIADLFGRL
jgi:sulfite reductase beta subunit-like hemoprotein